VSTPFAPVVVRVLVWAIAAILLAVVVLLSNA
jgi:hypothetical protein